MIGLGIWAFQQLKIEAYPDISDTQVVVVTLYPGRAAEEVEQQVTVPIERALNCVPNVIARRSRTIFGLSVVELTFAYGTNDYFARQVVLERMRDAQLPDSVTPSLGPLSTPIGELYRYSLEGNPDPMRLREVQDWVVTPRFLQVPGVADVTPFGGLIKQYQIEVDPQALATIQPLHRAGRTGDHRQQPERRGRAARQQAAVDGGARVGLVQNIQRYREHRGHREPRACRYSCGISAASSIGAAPQTGIFGVDAKTGGVEGIVLMRRGENPDRSSRRDQRGRRRDLNDTAPAARACASRRSTTARTWSATPSTRSRTRCSKGS